MKFGLMALAIVLVIGCSSKEEKMLMQEYKENKNYFRTLQKTEKIILTENNITKAVLIAEYMRDSTVKLSDEGNETFIIGLYLESEDIFDIKDIFGLKRDDNKTEVLKSIYDANKTQNKPVDEFANEEIGKYRLTLNGKKALIIKPLKINDKRLKNVALKTEWSVYAEVTFKHSKKRLMKLKFESSKYGIGEASFSKVAKYVYTKSAF